MTIYDDTPEGAPPIHTKIATNRATIRALRSGRHYQQLRDKHLTKARTHHNSDGSIGQHCWLCGEPIDYRLRFPHPRSWSLDHAVPVKDDPTLMLNTANFRSAHLECNKQRGSDAPRIELGEPSEIW